MAPLTRGRSGANRIPNSTMLDYYCQRSSAGMILTEATTISEQANGWVNSPGIYTDEMERGWAKIVEAVHAKGGLIFMQLWHCGRASHSAFHDGAPAVAPSAIKINGDKDEIRTPEGKQPYEVPRELQTDEVASTVEDYRKASERAKKAGFDGVEIHAANGYLIDTFLQSKTNQRKDKYGGSVKARFTMLNEVVEAISSVWPSRQVGVRISPNGSFNDMGSLDYRDQFTYIAKQLDKHNLAYLHVLDGLGFGFHDLGEPMTLAEIRQVYSGTIIGNVGYDKHSAVERIGSDDADLIAFGRPYISNPDLVERFKNDWPLNDAADQSVWYSDTGAEGYTDFPTYKKGQDVSG